MSVTSETGGHQTLPERGACFGFDVRSELDLSYLRDGPGEQALIVTEGSREGPAPDRPPDLEWAPRPGHPFHGRLWSRDGLFELWVAGTGWFGIDVRAPAIKVPRAHSPDVRREGRLWGIPAALCFAHRGDLPLHAATVEVDGAAIAFAAPGRFGKTTLAAAFLAEGHRVLSEDLTCCRLGSSAEVLPGPAGLRLRPDSYERLSLENVDVLARDSDRLHVVVRSGARGRGTPVPLRGIFFLRKVGYTAAPRPVGVDETIRNLWAVSFNLPEESDRIRCFEGVVALMRSVPVWDVARPASYDDLPKTVDTIISTCL